jgi:hypothetical protein
MEGESETLTAVRDLMTRVAADEGEILALLLEDAGEPRRWRTAGIHDGR